MSREYRLSSYVAVAKGGNERWEHSWRLFPSLHSSGRRMVSTNSPVSQRNGSLWCASPRSSDVSTLLSGVNHGPGAERRKKTPLRQITGVSNFALTTSNKLL